MWRKVKSLFILKKIFCNLDYKRKLIIIAYNNKLQGKLGLNLVDYKRYCGRYRKEKNGETYEFDSYYNRLLFEGIYSNGKRNGYGKEYNEDGNLIFEGEYLDGKRWKGIAKEYDEDTGKLIFEYGLLGGKIDVVQKNMIKIMVIYYLKVNI